MPGGKIMRERRVCLVVEDDDDIRGLISVVLAHEGFEVRTAATALAGLLAAADPSLSLITLDLGLPDLDRSLVVAAVKAQSSAPLLVLTARTAEEDVEASLAAGADAFLAKPFRPGELRSVVRKLTSAGRAQDPAAVGDPVSEQDLAPAG